MDKKKVFFRTGALAAIFCIACVIFTARLFSLQIINRDTYAPKADNNYISHDVAIVAQRGSICDRNGKVLVRNEYTYDLSVDYFSLPADVSEENAALLALVRAAESAGSEVILCSAYPLEGTYPDITYAGGEAAEAVKAAIIKRYKRKAEITAPELAKYLANRYDLLDSKKNLTCTPEEALLIMKLRWSLIADDFYNTGVYTLAKDINLDLITVISEAGLRGGRITTASERCYIYPGYASHLLGQVGKIYAEEWADYKAKGYAMDATVGISGCEKIFEDYLRGVDGVMTVQYDDSGNIVGQFVKTEPVAGRDVWLTIDIDLQIAAEDGLRENIDYVHSKATGSLTGEDASAGAFAMADTATGQVLAIASCPTYDLTTYNKNYEELVSASVSPLINRAINGLYAPGSTFKVGMAAAALGTGLITPQTIINTTGKYTYFPDYQPRCWYYTSTGLSHGPINVSEAIRVSCNCFFYELGRRLGITTMNEYCVKFGLGEPTGFELGGATGILAGPAYRELGGLAKWQETDTIVAAIGQSENLFSPLQITMYIGAIANGGTRYAATLFYAVKEFGADESTVSAAAPKVLSSFELSDYHRTVLLSAMEDVVSTSVSLKNTFRGVPVSVGGKTGTAQVGTTKSENALFVAVAPADNPTVAATCVIEQGHAGSSSAYTVNKVLEVYFSKTK